LERGGSSAVSRGRAGYNRRPHAHHQELNCSSSLWFYRWSVVVAVLLVAVGAVITGVLKPIIRSSNAVAASGFTVGAWW